MSTSIKLLSNKALYKAFYYAQKQNLGKDFSKLLEDEIKNRRMPLPLDFLDVYDSNKTKG